MKKGWIFLFVVALVGLVDSVYLLFTSHFVDFAFFSQGVCFGGGCNEVLGSSFATLFGIPISVTGIAVYLLLARLIFIVIRAEKASKTGDLILVVSGTGLLASVYLNLTSLND